MPEYPRKIKVSEKRKPQYYKWDGKNFTCKGKAYKNFEGTFTKDYLGVILEKGKFKYFTLVGHGEFKWKSANNDDIPLVIDHKTKVYLAHNNSLSRVIANPRTLGIPRYQRINFQDMYSGNLHQHTRAKIIIKLKDWMRPFIVTLPVITDLPILFLLEVVDTVKNSQDNSKNNYGRPFDIDNRGIIYQKCFLDLLVAEGKIPSDDRLFVTGSGCIFTPLPDNDDKNRELKFHITYDDREVIKCNALYKFFHAERKPLLARGSNNPW